MSHQQNSNRLCDEMLVLFKTTDKFFFPNQIAKRFSIQRLDDFLDKRSALADLRWSIKPPAQEPFHLNFDIRISSEGPNIVDEESASLFSFENSY